MVTAPEKRLGAPFWRFWTSAAAANVADGVRAAALPLIAASVSDNAFGVALIAACQQGAWLVFGLGAGVVADRYPPARVVAAADVLRVVMLAAVLTALFLDTVTIPLLAGAAFVIGVAETFRDTAAHSLVPRLVDQTQLERANGRLVGAEIVGNEFLGPLLGALLFAVAVTLPVALDATALLVAVVLILTLRRAAPAIATVDPAGSRPPLLVDLGRGARWLLSNPRLAAVTCSGAAVCFADSAWWSVLVVYSNDVLGLPEAGFGLLLTAGAVGGTVGALGAERLAGRLTPHVVLAAAALLCGLPAVAIALGGSLPVTAVMLAVSSGGFAVWSVVALSTRQREAPPEILGRVTGTHRLVLFGSGMVGALVGGVLADSVAITAPFYLAGALATVAAAGLLVVARTERRGQA
ncbi:MFS transporter [Plantactinospora endophytica]|uniref:MFS transporter n=1 Tax=Plantactinospora endophytica TaxID=673535 RepID=A0ABQ4DUX9_9ACTN|nr:MFS transporter [Plantactinospora endophytica]